MIAYGPVPSRRLGRSLGVNNIPPKTCTYSCVYCQLGRTGRMRVGRRAYYGPERVVRSVGKKLEAAARAGESVDWLALVPDGEPTLDANLGRTLRGLRGFGYPVAVISNGSLLWDEGVRTDLAEADWVSLKVDAAEEAVWKRVDRPHGGLELEAMLEGMRVFASSFGGELVTETMLVDGLNDGEEALRSTARYVGELGPATAYLSVPTRPPAEGWVRPAGEAAVARGYEVFRSWQGGRVALLLGYEGDAFASTGDAAEDLLSIAAVHPMREAAVRKLVERAGSDWGVVEGLVRSGRLVEVRYGGHRYYLRPVGLRRWSRDEGAMA